ncbi:hypothetical protein DFH09DRAFT_1105998 [Mycena vulgaris]|nr:hypothetical protein DFH09DRAFT_1105998 [Mycena vulgaris]
MNADFVSGPVGVNKCLLQELSLLQAELAASSQVTGIGAKMTTPALFPSYHQLPRYSCGQSVDVKVDSSLHSFHEFFYYFNLTSSNMVNTFFLAAFAAGLVTALSLYPRDSSGLFDIQSFQNVTLQACDSQTSGNITVSSVGFFGGLLGGSRLTAVPNLHRLKPRTPTDVKAHKRTRASSPPSIPRAVAAEAMAVVDISASFSAASASAVAAAATAPPKTSLPNSRVKQILDTQSSNTDAVNEDVEELSNL